MYCADISRDGGTRWRALTFRCTKRYMRQISADRLSILGGIGDIDDIAALRVPACAA